jgi:hypothetical protein
LYVFCRTHVDALETFSAIGIILARNLDKSVLCHVASKILTGPSFVSIHMTPQLQLYRENAFRRQKSLQKAFEKIRDER